MDSFRESLPMLNLTIAPVDQFFISRIERRDTWDIHLYFGYAFTLFTSIWIVINLIKRSKNYLLFKTVLFSSAIVLMVTGLWMWLRLYYPVSEETFGLLKKIHYFGYWIFIYGLIVHIGYVIYNENTKKKGSLSNMVIFKNNVASILALVIIVGFSTPSFAQTDLNKWLNDKNYIEGVLYIEGNKGFDVLTKKISNCPYDKCKMADIDQTQFGTKNIEIKKPDFKKAIELLSISSESGNPLAAEKLLDFLTKRVDYKSKKQNGYLVKKLKEDTGLNIQEYIVLVNKTVKEGIKTHKSCFSEFLGAELYERGALRNEKDLSLALKHYQNAEAICPSNNLFKMLASGKVNSLDVN
jgi:hypothetical protein